MVSLVCFLIMFSIVFFGAGSLFFFLLLSCEARMTLGGLLIVRFHRAEWWVGFGSNMMVNGMVDSLTCRAFVEQRIYFVRAAFEWFNMFDYLRAAAQCRRPPKFLSWDPKVSQGKLNENRNLMWTKRGKARLILIFSTNTNCENMAYRSFRSEEYSARGVRKVSTGRTGMR